MICTQILSGSGTTQYFNSFYLNNGYNDFRDNGVSGSYCMSGQFGAFCGGAVAANNNYWKTGGGAPVDGVDYLLYGGCTNPDNPTQFSRLQVTDNSSENRFIGCTPDAEPGPMALSASNEIGGNYRDVTTDLGILPLNETIEITLNTDMENGTVYDGETQYRLVAQLLNNNLTALNSAEEKQATHAYRMFRSNLGKQMGISSKADPAKLDQMLQIIQKLKEDDKLIYGKKLPKTHTSRYFELSIDEAQSLWLKQDFGGAITLLQNLSAKANADQLCEIQKLICQIEVDRAFIASGNALEIDELLTTCTECGATQKSGSINTSGGEQESTESPIHILNLELSLSVVPNPVTGSSEIRINGLQKEATLVVYHSNGAIVMTESIVTSSYSRLVSNTELPAGIYMVTLNVNGTVTQTLKMVVVQ
jgi:hypothetical protein